MSQIEETETSPTNNIFVADDFDFTNYNPDQLSIICEYQLPLRCKYPKLIVMLFENLRFKKWIEELDPQLLTEKTLLIENLILGISDWGLKNNFSVIDMEDNTIWQSIVEPFLLLNVDKKINQKKKSQTRKKKIKQRVRYVSI